MAVSDDESALPSEVEEKIEPNIKNDLRRKDVAEAFYEANRPYLETSHVKERVDGEFTRDTVSRRLNELVDAGILCKDSTGNADQYWIANNHSYWMVPDDVAVISGDNPEAITWNDLLNDRLSRNFGWGLLTSSVSGIMITSLSFLAVAIGPDGIFYNSIALIMAFALIGALIGFTLCILAVAEAKFRENESELNKVIPI